MATLDVLGEEIHDLSETAATVEEYQRALVAIAAEGLDSNVSVKLTALGLKLDADHCRSELETLAAASAPATTFASTWRTPRTPTPRSASTASCVMRGRQRRPRPSGVPPAHARRRRGRCRDARERAHLQGHLRRAAGDRLSGARGDPRQLLREARGPARVRRLRGIATHDEFSSAERSERGSPHEAYEFQMLLGVREPLGDDLVDQGHRLRVYVPYGEAVVRVLGPPPAREPAHRRTGRRGQHGQPDLPPGPGCAEPLRRGACGRQQHVLPRNSGILAAPVAVAR